MDLNELLRPEAVIANLKANSKKQALQELAERASEICGETERDIFDTLLQRERLGSTGVGNGIAIPHGKIVNLDGLHGLFARLDKPIEFDSLDDQPVDLIFVLLAPEGAGADHLKALARVARLLRDADVASKLRATTDADAIYSILTHPQASPNAA
ncbi:PTS IIA-like nitrogen-regulatory protein PtsN [Pseudovibrio japonicus]|uniref:PTS IIA-like nitrogen-regulatory protein PtsN n=1 Tax=Pseudovibrio japonicus TaxID=366534 RepID=A0ABQ3E6E0_9HYPH|nr:PTS IIA-like nitrogen regulatory protein PtsN [Pseudovibrio japonicus]GHB24914.1 PTS IIA-like nitrogen-regulatory protein PtsN [Pseudovibrio japonicus]